jgi:HK97 family phage portal protein
MNWFQKMFVKAASTVIRFAPKWVRYTFLPVSITRMLNGYRKNSAVAACATTLAFSFPEPPLLSGKLVDGRFVADYRHKINALLRRPNPDMGHFELMQFAVTYASIGGNCYLWKQRSQNGRVIALWPFSDLQITPVPGETIADGLVRYYEFDPGDGEKIPIPKSDIVHWKWMVDIERPWRGIGAVEFAIREVDRDSEATAYVYALLKNNAVPPVVVTLAEGDELTDDKANRLRASWRDKLGGENAGNVAFLESGMKAEKMGFDLQQLAAEALNAVPESRIAAAFRVPPVVAGLSVGLKRSDYGDQAARRAFTELTLSALWQGLASELLESLRDDFALTDDFALEFDLRKVRALQEEEVKRWERVTLAWNRSLLTRAEAKAELGMEPHKGDDVYFVSLASEFVPAGTAVVRTAAHLDGGEKGETPQAFSLSPLEGGMGRPAGLKAAVGVMLQRVRNITAKRMETAVNVYFAELGRQAVERADPPAPKGASPLAGGTKSLPDPSELVTAEDNAKLAEIVRRYYVEVLELSWEAWNIALGVELAFDLGDPAVVKVIKLAGTRVKDIQQATMDALRETLAYGAEQGWSVDDLVRGDPENGVRGLRDIIAETYKDRARTVARAELGEAQNTATAARYAEAGVSAVEILDGGAEDSAPACQEANGKIWTLELFDQHHLQHPNCSRCAVPYFGDDAPMTSWSYSFGERG